MIRLWPHVVVVLGLAVPPQLPVAEPACGTFLVAAESLDLAPPAGFTEICSQDAELCRKLTSGYPPNVQTEPIERVASEDDLQRGFRKWTGNDESGHHHHGRVSLQEKLDATSS
jgi:hypothetical protein